MRRGRGSRRSFFSRALCVSEAARSNSARASSRRPSFTRRSPRTRPEMVVLESRLGGERIDERQPFRRTEGHGDRYRAVQLHDGRRRDLRERVVERSDARPVVSSAVRERAWQAAIAACSA